MSLSARGAATRFCQHVFPFLSDFQSHGVAPATVLRFNFYSGSGWWSASSMPQVGARTHSLAKVVWHEWLFRCLAATILIVQLIALEAQLETWGPTAMAVLVVCYLHRLAQPLAVYLEPSRKGLLRCASATNVQVCIVDTLTRPTSEISHITRHRHVAQAEDPHEGNEADLHRLSLNHCVVG